MVGVYEPYVAVCRRLAELSPCAGEEQKSILVNSGAEAVENAVKIARCATGRPAVVVFDNAFHGRTLLTMTMTAKVKPYKAGFGPFAPEVYRAPRPESLPRGLERRRDRRPEAALQGRRRSRPRSPVPSSSRCRARAASSPCLPTTSRGCTSSAASTGSSTSTTRCSPGVGRTGKMWAVEHSTASSPTCSSREVDRRRPAARRASRAAPRSWTRYTQEASAAPSAATRSPVRPRSRCSTRWPSRRFLEQATALGETMRARLEALAARHDAIGEVRGLGPMLAFELVEQAPEQASAHRRRGASSEGCCSSPAACTGT